MKKTIWIIFIALTVVQIPQPANAYIDPGTGSMLFSVVLCSITTIFFLLDSIFIKLKRLIVSDKKLSLNKHKIVVYSEGKQYYCVFKPILDEFESRKIPLMYYTSSKEDPFFQDNYNYVKGEYIGQGNKAYFKLAFLNADVCLMTTPQLDVLQLKRSKKVKHYSHIFHSIGFAMGYRLFGLDYYDSVLCDASFQIPLIREIEKKRNLPSKECIVVGSTYMDYNIKKLEHIPSEHQNIPTILLAPSWGNIGFLKQYGDNMLNQLKNGNYNIIVRPHPQSLLVERNYIDNLMKKFAATPNIQWDFSEDNTFSMAKASLLISDYSSITLDFAFLFNKPFAYIKTDYKKYSKDSGDLDNMPWNCLAIQELGHEIFINNGFPDNLQQVIKETLEDKALFPKIQKAKNYAWEYQGEAAKNVVDFLIKKQTEFEKNDKDNT